MHTNHTRKTDDIFPLTNSPTRGETIITSQDRQRAQQLLGLLKIKINYKRQDLFREKQKIKNAESFYVEEGGLPEEVIKDSIFFTGKWEFLLEREELIDALKELSLHQQHLIWLLFVEGKTQKEVAQLWGVSPATISQTKARAYQHLQHSLEQKGGGSSGR